MAHFFTCPPGHPHVIPWGRQRPHRQLRLLLRQRISLSLGIPDDKPPPVSPSDDFSSITPKRTPTTPPTRSLTELNKNNATKGAVGGFQFFPRHWSYCEALGEIIIYMDTVGSLGFSLSSSSMQASAILMSTSIFPGMKVSVATRDKLSLGPSTPTTKEED